jgi:homotetrameric cytidine deaminase
MSTDTARAVAVATEARRHSHSPYSHFAVGAALKLKGKDIYVPGCNVENASFGGTICAERSAVVAAISQYGKVEFESVTVVTDTNPPAYPCAFCRGVLSEFCDGDLVIYLANPDGVKITTTLGEVLPHPFKL